MESLLLDKSTANLNRLSLSRIQLHREDAHVIIQPSGHEQLLYALTGSVRILDYREGGAADLGTFGGRRSVWESKPTIVRIPPTYGNPLSLILASETADLLLVACETQEHESDGELTLAFGLKIDQDVREHQVGEGCYARMVREFSPPEGYKIHAGETLNPPGHWSSFPSHASKEDLPNYALHEEVFMIFTRGYALIMMDGIYCDGQPVQDTRKVHNGEAFVTPLGQHPIVALPDAPLVYFWAYISGALKKEYREWATDVGIYRR